MAEPGPWLPEVHASPNIQEDPDLYEIENAAVDPEGRLFEALARVLPWDDQVVVDLGAGTGFWVPHLAAAARHVFAVEPHGPSRTAAMARLSAAGIDASVVAGAAARTHLQRGSVDRVFARFAYFWGPGCEGGLDEVRRILRPGGGMAMIDNDLREGTFAQWVQRAYPRDPDAIDAFWAEQGFAALRVPSCWRFSTRPDLERVVRHEFRDHAPALLAGHRGLEIEVVFRVFWRRFGRPD